jgi:[phosphatase 2A protein]-leucine-carboxy methyltransferase
MRKSIDKFLEISSSPSGCQIINIGAGYDTMCLHLAERNLPNLSVFEIDFPDIILKKANILIQAREIHGILFDDGTTPTLQSASTEYGFHMNQIKLISSNLFLPEEFIQSLLKAGFQSSLPTLILTECVLVCMILIFSVFHSFHLRFESRICQPIAICCLLTLSFPNH